MPVILENKDLIEQTYLRFPEHFCVLQKLLGHRVDKTQETPRALQRFQGSVCKSAAGRCRFLATPELEKLRPLRLGQETAFSYCNWFGVGGRANFLKAGTILKRYFSWAKLICHVIVMGHYDPLWVSNDVLRIFVGATGAGFFDVFGSK